jgi:uncharacterized UPF0160 family protein
METVRIVTHSGGFHADDVFATALLKAVSEKEGKKVEVARSREKEVWQTGTYVIDVGGVYNEALGRFDHHQEGGAGVRENGIPYSSFGLVWKRFGESVCGNKKVADEVERLLVVPIDAHDCGVELVQNLKEGLQPLSISFLIHIFDPIWKETNDENLFRGFGLAMEFATTVTERLIIKIQSGVEAEEVVTKALLSRENPKLLILDQYIPWEIPVSKVPGILYVVHPHPRGNWSVEAVRENLAGFKNRKDLPQAWAGKVNEELQKITGVADATFCHNARFTCGAGSKEGALALAKLALDN